VHSSFMVRSARGKNSKGRKITSCVTIAGATQADEKLLVATNDSRIRLYNLADKSLDVKFKGHENLSSQIRATASEDGRYVISGSEDRHVYIWDSCVGDGADSVSGWLQKKREKGGCESFPGALRKNFVYSANIEADGTNMHLAESDIVTCTAFAPSEMGIHLMNSEDPILVNAPLKRFFSTLSASLSLSPVQSRQSIVSESPPPPAAPNTSGGLLSPLSAGGVGSNANPNGNNNPAPSSPRQGSPISGAEHAIIAVADDRTGFIHIYRNSPVPMTATTMSTPMRDSQFGMGSPGKSSSLRRMSLTSVHNRTPVRYSTAGAASGAGAGADDTMSSKRLSRAGSVAGSVIVER
jgi:hypothetical protein